MFGDASVMDREETVLPCISVLDEHLALRIQREEKILKTEF